jgi:2,3-bisphosphoglycerate-dependent phosphoglycerate mutase
MMSAQNKVTEIYMLRHATPAKSELPNRARPLSDVGQQQATALVPYLSALGITTAYTSPFQRAVESVTPFCKAEGLTPVEREDLGESGEDEKFPDVRSRLIQALSSVADNHVGEQILVCTHGGCLWGAISYFDESFEYEDYRKIRTPDMRKFVFGGEAPWLDSEFVFDLV